MTKLMISDHTHYRLMQNANCFTRYLCFDIYSHIKASDTMIDFLSELLFQSSRSGGKGGQNVNKVETRVEARWHVANSQLINQEQKERILLKLAKQISKDGFLMVQCSDTRSQLENKSIAIERIHSIVNKALHVAKKRKATKTPKSAVEKRLTGKKINAEKKANRRADFE